MLKVLILIFCVIVRGNTVPHSTQAPDVATTNPSAPPKDYLNVKLIPGHPELVQEGYRESFPKGEGSYAFVGKDGFEILANCYDLRPALDFVNPCSQFRITFDDGKTKTTHCGFYWLTEVFFTTKQPTLKMDLMYNFTAGVGLFRCVIRTTEPFPPTVNLTVPSKIDSFQRSELQEDIYAIEAPSGKEFNIDCKFKDTENAFCTLSRVVVTTDKEDMFCKSREYRRKGVKKATIRVFSDSKGWPELYCSFTQIPTSSPDTAVAHPYDRAPIDRKKFVIQPEVTWTLKAGETKEINLNKNATKKIFTWNVQVEEGHKIYVFCSQFDFRMSYNPVFPCDPFRMTMEESGRISESWCSRRHLESLGYLSDSPKLKLTVESFSGNNRVICAVRTTQPPPPQKTHSLSQGSPNWKIDVPKGKDPYLFKRWVVKHPNNGQITIKCDHNILRAIYHTMGVGIIKRQYFCYQRRIQVNSHVECEEPNPPRDDPIVFEAQGKADIAIMTDRDGLGGHLCDVIGHF